MEFLRKIKNLFVRKKKPVLGLALGSGGAKGMAHLGALRAFAEEGIEFDRIAGTSIGSIVGALYAKGYTVEDMESVVENINMKEFSRTYRPFSDMSFVERLLEGYLEGNIEDLPKPFAAWATNAEDNGGVLLDRGKTARAVTASSAIPPFFRSVEMDGKRLYDGAYTNAIPADVVKSMGADIVIGIDLSAYLTPNEEKTAFSKLLGTALGALDPMVRKPDCKTRGYEAADLMLRPMLRGYRATDVSPSAMRSMYELGYREAVANMDEIKRLIGT